MSDQKHFNYSGSATLRLPEVSIKSVKFLVPVHIEYVIGDKEESATGSVDYGNQEVHINGVSVPLEEKLKEKVLEYLKITTSVPVDKYALSEDEVEKIAKAQEEYRKLSRDHTGGEDE